MKNKHSINRQRGNIAVEYLLATMMVLSIVFGVEVNDKNLWNMFKDAYQTRHDNYTHSINNLDNVDISNNSE